MAYIAQKRLFNPSALNAGLAMQQQGLNTIFGSINNGFNDLSNYRAKQEDERYKQSLLNNGMLNSFNHINKGTEYERIDPTATSGGSNIYSMINQNIAGMTDDRRSKIFNSLLKQRELNAQSQNQLLKSNIGYTKSKQIQGLNNYLAKIGDTNKDGRIDINDLNNVEKQGILANGALFGSVQNQLTNTAIKNQQANLLHKQQMNDKKELINLRKRNDFDKLLLINKLKQEKQKRNFENQIKMQNAIFGSTNNSDNNGYIKKEYFVNPQNGSINYKLLNKHKQAINVINNFGEQRPKLARQLLQGLDITNPNVSTQVAKKLLSYNDKLSNPKTQTLINKYNNLKKEYNATGDNWIKIQLSKTGEKLSELGLPIKVNTDKDINEFISKEKDFLNNIAKSEGNYITQNGSKVLKLSVLNDEIEKLKQANANGLINNKQYKLLSDYANNISKPLLDATTKNKNPLTFSNLPDRILHPRKPIKESNIKNAVGVFGKVLDSIVNSNSKFDSSGLNAFSDTADFENYLDNPDRFKIMQTAFKEVLGLKHEPTKKEIEQYIYNNIHTSSGYNSLSWIPILGTSMDDFGASRKIKKGSDLDKIITRAAQIMNRF